MPIKYLCNCNFNGNQLTAGGCISPLDQENMNIQEIIVSRCQEGILALYGQEVEAGQLQLQKTNKEFTGDYTIVVFPLLKISRKGPEQTARELGDYLLSHESLADSCDVVKGFLNISLKDVFWLDFLMKVRSNEKFGMHSESSDQTIMVEFSSPNTNKPLHLGHIRNNLLGDSVSRMLQAAGRKVIKANMVNDRGIHICKSMLAYLKWGNGETPETTGLKGDHLVGKYYVMFDQHYKREIERLIAGGMDKDEAGKNAGLILEAQEMLRKWEAGDADVRELWRKMNGWTYEGFEATYHTLGITFDKTYYESETYLLGKTIVEEGIEKGVLFRKEDGSAWIDLTTDGLDEKLLLRGDGTSVYITQDLGTAELRYNEYHPSKMIYVVGNEQNYHFDVLKLALNKLGKSYAPHILHLSYGMIELPEGKMKSREGTVVDADDLMEEMFSTAKETNEALGKTDAFTEEEKTKLFRMLGLGALKYFILKVDPKKNMRFNPSESIDFNGNTGPFIQYTHARIRSLLRKAAERGIDVENSFSQHAAGFVLNPLEKEILRLQHDFPDIILEAAEKLSPALLANYLFEHAKAFNTFYQEIPVLKEEDPANMEFRLHLSKLTATILKNGMQLLGIDVPEKM